MRNRPTEFPNIALYFLVLILLLGCSKDSDLLNDAIFNGENQSVEDRTKTETSTEESQSENQEVVVPSTETETETVAPVEEVNSPVESRLSTFSALHDAHIQSGKSYNQSIIRLEEGHRTSYLMFDLSPIDSIGGTITEAKLQITINGDDGDGTVSVHKGVSSDWTENNLSSATPDIESELGSLTKQYKIGATEEISLDVSSLQETKSTLILEHKEGNDLAFASKEHPSDIGPKLVVAYDTPVGADPIEIPEVIIEEVPTTEEEVPTESEETQNETNTGENEGPMAVADATPSAGGAPLNVQFKGSNSTDDKEVKTFSWDFKDGSSASTANPSHSFNEPGTYEVLLTVTDEQGLKDTDAVTITVTEEDNEAPIAVATATPNAGAAPLEVQFKGSNSTDDNSISSYSWDFKDGATASNANPSHTFNQPGTYQVVLTVKDENGLSHSKTVTITVNEASNEAPKAVATATPSSGVAPLEVQFKGSDSTDDKEVKTYFWNFKDGSTASAANPSHTFATPGTYEVRFTVKDAEEETDSQTITINVSAPEQNEAPVAVVTANPTSGQAPLNVQFVGNNSTDDNAVTSYLWNFKDGSTATSANPSHTFNAAGSYPVTLTVKDAAGLSSTKTVNITVNSQNDPPPPPDGTNVDYYVTTTGNASNNGKTQSTAWSLEHAFKNAKAGDVIYVRAGNYGNKQIVMYQSGTSGNPIKFIGYKNSPGDVVSSGKSTFSHGQSLSSSQMPLLKGSSTTQGLALDLNGSYVEIHNFQITDYQIGILTKGRNSVLKNVIVARNGNQTNDNSQTGRGIIIHGDGTLVENSFSLNSNSEGINIKGADNCTIKNTQVYSDNLKNMTGYYILIGGGGKNNLVDNCTLYRDPSGDNSGAPHQGHGFIMKDRATNNIVRNSKAYNTGVQVNFSGVFNNTFDNIDLFGKYSIYKDQHSVAVKVMNGAHDNTFKNIDIKDARYAVGFIDFNDGFTGSQGDLDKNEGGHNNKFININLDGGKNCVVATSVVVGPNAFSNNNQFTNCTFKNVTSSPFFSYQDMNGTKFTQCTFQNIPSSTMTKLYEGGTFPITFENCNFSNVGFPNPN